MSAQGRRREAQRRVREESQGDGGTAARVDDEDAQAAHLEGSRTARAPRRRRPLTLTRRSYVLSLTPHPPFPRNAPDRTKTEAEASRALREHFSGRTAALLVPLNRYLNTLLPAPPTRSAVSAAPPPPSTAALASASFTSFTSLASGASTSFASGPSAAPSPMPSPTPLAATAPAGYAPAPAGPARLKPFSTPAFLASLSAPGAAAPLPFKSSARRREFYARWVRSPAFALWLARQEEVVRATF